MDDTPYLMRGIRQIPTDSSVLISSSPYLNDPRIRDWVATHMLRRSGQDRPSPSDSIILVGLLREVQDIGRIEEMLVAERKRNAALDRWFAEGFVSTFTREDLAGCPPGSVGGVFHRYLAEKGFEVDLVPRYTPKTNYDYFQFRAGQTHDLEHVICGGGFDYIGELVPYYMRLTNLFKHLSPELAGELSVFSILGATRIMTRSVLHYPQTWPTVLETVERGSRVGKASGPIFMARYEDVLQLPLAEARRRLGVEGAQDVDTSAASAIWEEIVPPHDDPALRLWRP
jgi:ubiquinone biosynthesis protein Coq4